MDLPTQPLKGAVKTFLRYGYLGAAVGKPQEGHGIKMRYKVSSGPPVLFEAKLQLLYTLYSIV